MADRRFGWLRVFFENRLAVFGLVLIGLFAVMVIAHPILMATLWADETKIYDVAAWDLGRAFDLDAYWQVATAMRDAGETE